MPTSSPLRTLKLTPCNDSVVRFSASRDTSFSIFSSDFASPRKNPSTDSFSIINFTSCFSLISLRFPRRRFYRCVKHCIYLQCGRSPPCGERQRQLPYLAPSTLQPIQRDVVPGGCRGWLSLHRG